MPLVIKESIQARLVCQNASQINTVKTEIDKYAAKPRNGAVGDPDYVQSPAGWYGPGPTLQILMEFRNRQDADDAWVDVSKWSNFFQDNSMFMQYTSYSDPENGVNDAVFHHRINIPAKPDDIP